MQLAISMQANKLDDLAEKMFGISPQTLMDNATTALCDKISKDVDIKKTIGIFCGRGKNGGDGFWLSCKLSEIGYKVTVIVCFSENDNVNELTKMTIGMVRQKNIKIVYLSDFKKCEVYIDALLGTGFQGEISGDYKHAIEIMNNSGAKVISLDLPSGLNCDNAKYSGTCVKATKTYTIAINKVGLNSYPGAEFCGEVSVVDIGIPKECYSKLGINLHLVDNEFAKSIFPIRVANSHKGTYGKTAVFGGSEGMAGSVVMAAEGVLRSGAAICYACVNDDIFNIVENKVTEIIVKHDKDYKNILPCVDSIVIGSGYVGNSKLPMVAKMAQQNSIPVVLDAQGLKYINKKDRKCPLVITPHPKEFSELVGLSVQEVNDNRIYLPQKFAKENNVVVVLKGARTVIASPNGEVRINSSGTNGMATAGSGDVLSGIIGGFLAQGLTPFDSATLGVYIHGLAGELGACELSDYSLKATDILKYIGKAFLYE